MEDEAGDMIEVLKRQVSTVQTTLAARQARELQSVHHSDRRIMRTPPEHVRSLQLNLRVSPRFKQRVTAYSIANGVSVTEALVQAFDALAARDKK